MQQLKTHLPWLWRYRLPIITGIVTPTSYIPFAPWAQLFCLVPLWIFYFRNPQPERVWTAGWVSQYLFTLIGFHWVAHTAHDFGHMPWAVSILILLAFAAFANLHITIVGLIWSLFHRALEFSKVQTIIFWVAGLSLAENITPMIFQWNFGAAWLWGGWPGFQWADVIGFQGLSSTTFLFNGALTLAWLEHRNWPRSMAWLAGAIVAFGAFNWSGSVRGQKWNTTDTQIKIIQVQPNIGNFEKEYAQHGLAYQDFIVDRSTALSAAALVRDPSADLVIWPETAYPDYLEPHSRKPLLFARLAQYVRGANVPLLTGAYSKDQMSSLEYNGLFLLDKQAELIGKPYRKSVLLAFGEYFPLGETFPILYRLVPVVSRFGRGEGPQILTLNDHHLGAQICYESLFPEFSASLAKLGADVIVNLTNDSWFGNTFEPYQHLYLTFERAIENRRPLVRVTNTGVSTVMLASGQILSQSPLQVEWTQTQIVPYQKNAPLTFFTQYQQWVPLFWLAILGGILLIRVYERTKKSRLGRAGR